MKRHRILLSCLIAMISFSSVASASKIYVQAGAIGTSDGTKQHPYNSLQQVQDHSNPGDTIVILNSSDVLDGGIILKDNQTLLGNTTVNCNSPGRFKPIKCTTDAGGTTITNTTPGNIFDFNPFSGAGIVLAKNNTISGVSLKMTNSSAIIGFDPGKVTVSNVLIEGGNQIKKLDPTFNRLAPAAPVFPVAAGINIRFTANSADNTQVSINDIMLRSATPCSLTGPAGTSGCNFGPGIEVIGDGVAKVDIKKGILTDLRNNPISNQTGPPILLMSTGNATLTTQIDSITTFGGIDNDGIDIWLEDASNMTVGLNKYHYVGSAFNDTTDRFRQVGLEVITHLSLFLNGFPPVFPDIKPQINLTVHDSYFDRDEIGTIMFLRNSAHIDLSGSAFTNASIVPVSVLAYEPTVLVNAINNYWDDSLLISVSGEKMILNPNSILRCLISNYNFATGICANTAEPGSIIETAPAKSLGQ